MNFLGMMGMGMMNPLAMMQLGMQASQMMMGGGSAMGSPFLGDQSSFSPQGWQQMQMMQYELQLLEMGMMMGMMMSGQGGYGGQMPGMGYGYPGGGGYGGFNPWGGYPGAFPGGSCHCHGGYANPMGNAQPPSGPPPTGRVADWIHQAKAIMAQNGMDVSRMSDADLAMIIQHESGGNPHAINGWDSNARAGHPSKGLMQTIDSTFNANALPGHNDIWNPVDNIIAGTRYAIRRYGSLDNVPGVRAVHNGGRYVGY